MNHVFDVILPDILNALDDRINDNFQVLQLHFEITWVSGDIIEFKN
jgi:hypothetical protein